MMEVKRVDHVLVSDTDHVLLGIISDRDCEQRKGKRAADIMTAEPVSVDADSDLSPAVTMLVRKRITCLPVTSDGKLIGILTTTDFLMALQCALHTLSNVADQFTGSSGDSPLAGKAKEMRLNSDGAESITRHEPGRGVTAGGHHKPDFRQYSCKALHSGYAESWVFVPACLHGLQPQPRPATTVRRWPAVMGEWTRETVIGAN